MKTQTKSTEARERASFFSYDPDNGMTFHETEDAAKRAAEFDLESCRDLSADEGWPEGVAEICYGRVIAAVEQTEYIPRPPDDEIDEDGNDENGVYWNSDWSYMANYGLKPAGYDASEARTKSGKVWILAERIEERATELGDAILEELVGYLKARLSGEVSEEDEEAS